MRNQIKTVGILKGGIAPLSRILFTRPQAGAYEANRRRRLLGRVGDFAAEGKVTRAGARNNS